jgi:DoxX-like family
MDTALWIVQTLLAGLFLATGMIKLTQPRLKMAAGPMGWAADVTDTQFRAIGVLEVLGALGLLLPATVGFAPGLLPLAAIGLALMMVGAITTHVRYGEPERVVVPIIVLGLALFVAIERLGAYSL